MSGTLKRRQLAGGALQRLAFAPRGAESWRKMPERSVPRAHSAGRGGAAHSSRQGALAPCVCAARTKRPGPGSCVRAGAVSLPGARSPPGHPARSPLPWCRCERLGMEDTVQDSPLLCPPYLGLDMTHQVLQSRQPPGGRHESSQFTGLVYDKNDQQQKSNDTS